jgi:hypothetical protein
MDSVQNGVSAGRAMDRIINAPAGPGAGILVGNIIQADRQTAENPTYPNFQVRD